MTRRAAAALEGKVVVVTGGTAGVGRAAVDAFVRAGARVVALSRDADRVAAVAEALGPSGTARRVDVSDPEAVVAAAADIESELGPIDIWVNNAMTTVFGRFTDMPLDDFAKVTANTYLGTVNGTRAALDRMRARDRGTIVQVGSALAYQSIPLQSAYCGAKHAMRGFTNAVRAELRAEGSAVRLVVVHLSAFNTPQFGWARSWLTRHPQPLPPIFDPAIAAEAILAAAARPRREIWVGWPAVQTILASRIWPGLADRYAGRVAVDGQMLDDTEPPREGNLYAPCPGPATANGRFVDRARSRSWQWSLSKHRRAAALVVVAVMAAGVAATAVLG